MKKDTIKIIFVAGARPNFVKIAPLIEVARKNSKIEYKLVHTGQHYDRTMSEVFFRELHIPLPDYNLHVGSKNNVLQTAEIMKKMHEVFLKERPDAVVVVGDTNSTLGGALSAAQLRIPVAHVEAGLRSFDMTMPEETNRKVTDHLADFLFVTEQNGVKNLLREGIARKKIHFVGNVMIDSLKKQKMKISHSGIAKKLGVRKKRYAVLTLHRPSNVDDTVQLNHFLTLFLEIQKKIKIVFPIHPRTKKQLLKTAGFDPARYPNLLLIDPLGYTEFLSLIKDSMFVMTDSGGLQEETTFLRVPCLTIRENTERPVTVEKGTNILCGRSKTKIMREVNAILEGKRKKGEIPPLWDGKSSQRVIRILAGN